MQTVPSWAKGLRILAIVLMGITAFLTLASGAGTVCVALAAERWESMAPLAPYKWLYLTFVVLTIAVGVMGIRAVRMLLGGRKGAFRFTLLTLVSGILIGAIHILVSRALRGKSMPTDPVVYITLFTLFLFLTLRLPAVWEKIDFEQPKNGSAGDSLAAAITLAACGILTFALPSFAAPSHTFEAGGVNWANAWATGMNLLGSFLCLAAFLVLLAAKTNWRSDWERVQRQIRATLS